MRVRPVHDDDLPAVAAIAAANDETDGADPGYVAHLRRHGRFLVAVSGGEVAGYCATRRIGAATMLCDLFVAPDRQGQGVGGRLLAAALAGAGPRFTFASTDPRAMPLYVRHGMVPRWPLLYLSGPAPAAVPARARARTVPASAAGAAERRLRGVDRDADYAHWGTLPGGRGVTVHEGDELIAAGAVRAGALVHLATAGGHDPAAALSAALTVIGGERVRVCLPGPHPAVPLLLGAGWRIDGYDHHMSSEPGLLRTGLVPSPALA